MTDERKADQPAVFGDGPTISATKWQAAAIASVIVTVVLVLFAFFLWVMRAGSEPEILQRLQIVGGCSAFGLAIVTFCTVMWRGLLTTKQTDLQQRQIDKLTEQIAATDRQNLAALFHKGTELIAAGDQASVAAGISTLQIVAAGPDEGFGVQAINIIADHLQDQGVAHLTTPQGQNAVAAINKVASAIGRYGQRSLSFSFPANAKHELWANILPIGAGSVSIENAEFVDEAFHLFSADTRRRLLLRKCDFDGCEIDMRKFRVLSSSFERCTFRYFRRQPGNVYKDCDFSGCEISGKLPDLRSSGCYYVEDNPPKAQSDRMWLKQLNVRSIEFENVDELHDDANEQP